MAYNKESQQKYNEKCVKVTIKFTPNEMDLFNLFISHCEKNDLSKQGYIKTLIRKDLEQHTVTEESAPSRTEI